MSVFILDLTRRDGRRFVTSVSRRSDIPDAVQRHDGQTVTVSHWAQDGEPIDFYPCHSGSDWKLHERYAL